VTTWTGRLLFHSETGTEGGWYAFQSHAPGHAHSYDQPCFYVAASADSCPTLMTDEHGKRLTDWHYSYDGLMRLRNGDRLVVKGQDGSSVVWEGEVQLEGLPLFSHGVGPYWVNQIPAGISKDSPEEITWASMFFDGMPAELTREDA
jgi:hypothetical protein